MSFKIFGDIVKVTELCKCDRMSRLTQTCKGDCLCSLFLALHRNCLLQQVIEGKIKGQIEVTRRRGKRSKKLLDDLKDRRGYCQLKEEALDRTMWRNRFGRGFGPVV